MICGGLESGVLALVERTRSDDRTPQNLISGATSWSQAAFTALFMALAHAAVAEIRRFRALGLRCGILAQKLEPMLAPSRCRELDFTEFPRRAEIWRSKLVALEEAMNGRGSVHGLPSDCADSRGFQTGIGRSADGRLSDLFEVAMVARGRENLIFNDARVWRGTNPSIVLEFLDFRAWPASRPTQILERRLRPLCLEHPKAKAHWPKHRCASGITRVAPAAECAPPRTRHRPQARGAGNSHFSSENFVGDLRANGCSQRASNPVDGEYDSNPFFHNCSPRSNGMTAEQFRYASTTNRANRTAIAASSLAVRADF